MSQTKVPGRQMHS